MGPVRSDGYQLDSPRPPPASSSPQLNGLTPAAPHHSPRKKTPPHSPPSSVKTPGGRRPGERVHRHRRQRDTGCRNPQVRKGIGSCVFVLGIPCLIAGLILTIVSSTEDGEDARKYPSSFPVLGPVLLALSVVCFLTGVLLYNVAILRRLQDCLDLSDRDGCCRRRFPRFCAWVKPDPNLARNQTALNNLQTAPARSAMRKMPNPDLVAMETELSEGEGRHHGNALHYHHHHHVQQYPPRRKRAVTFSQGDDSSEAGFVGVRLNSVSSEPDRLSMQSENCGGSSLNGHSPSSSLLSLRHCRIYPKDEVFWTEGSGKGGEEEEGGGGMEEKGRERGGKGDGLEGDSSVRVLPDVGEGGGGRGRGVSLTDIDEEGV